MNEPIRCPTCKAVMQWTACAHCDGSGIALVDTGFWATREEDCRNCQGAGGGFDCSVCDRTVEIEGE